MGQRNGQQKKKMNRMRQRREWLLGNIWHSKYGTIIIVENRLSKSVVDDSINFVQVLIEF